MQRGFSSIAIPQHTQLLGTDNAHADTTNLSAAFENDCVAVDDLMIAAGYYVLQRT